MPRYSSAHNLLGAVVPRARHCETVTNLVHPDDKVSRNTIRLQTRLQQAFDMSWRLSPATGLGVIGGSDPRV
jgi:hypothetical protein